MSNVRHRLSRFPSQRTRLKDKGDEEEEEQEKDKTTVNTNINHNVQRRLARGLFDARLFRILFKRGMFSSMRTIGIVNIRIVDYLHRIE
jgi:hypothetical protein